MAQFWEGRGVGQRVPVARGGCCFVVVVVGGMATWGEEDVVDVEDVENEVVVGWVRVMLKLVVLVVLVVGGGLLVVLVVGGGRGVVDLVVLLLVLVAVTVIVTTTGPCELVDVGLIELVEVVLLELFVAVTVTVTKTGGSDVLVGIGLVELFVAVTVTIITTGGSDVLVGIGLVGLLVLVTVTVTTGGGVLLRSVTVYVFVGRMKEEQKVKKSKLGSGMPVGEAPAPVAMSSYEPRQLACRESNPLAVIAASFCFGAPSLGRFL